MILRPQILRPSITQRLLLHPCRRQKSIASAIADDSTEPPSAEDSSRPPSTEDGYPRRWVTNPLHERRRYGVCFHSLRLQSDARVLELDLKDWGTYPFPPMAFKRWLKEYPDEIRHSFDIERKLLTPDPDGYIRALPESVLNCTPQSYDVVCLSGIAHLFYPRLKTFLPTLRGLLKPKTGTLVFTAYFDPILDSVPKSYMRIRSPSKKLIPPPKRRVPPKSTPNSSIYYALESLREAIDELVTISETYNRTLDEFFQSASAFDPNIITPSEDPDSLTPLPPSESLPPALREQKENVTRHKEKVLETNSKIIALFKKLSTEYRLPERTMQLERDLTAAMSRTANSLAPYRLYLTRNESGAGRDLACIKRSIVRNKTWRKTSAQVSISRQARAYLRRRRQTRRQRPMLRRESWRGAFTENLWQTAVEYKLPLQEHSGVTRKQYKVEEIARMLRTSVELTDTDDEELERLVADLAKAFKTRSGKRLNFYVGWYFGHITRT